MTGVDLDASAGPVTAGLYGKHPAFGDFITAGLSQSLSDCLEVWLNDMLPDLRVGVGDDWTRKYDAAPTMRIWIGPGLMPEGLGFSGIMAATRDKVGRRFPLLAGVEGGDIAPPVADVDQTLYAGIEAFLSAYRRDGDDARAFATKLTEAVASDLEKAHPMPLTDFWAARPDGNVARLWSDVKAADTARAQATRTYLWRSAKEGSALYVTDGLPRAAVFAWMMGAEYTPESSSEAVMS